MVMKMGSLEPLLNRIRPHVQLHDADADDSDDHAIEQFLL